MPPSLTLVFQSVLENSPFLHISPGKLVGNQSAEEFPPLHSEPGRDRSPHGQVCPARQRQGHRLLRASQATGSPAGGLCQPRRRLFPARCGLRAAVPSHPWGAKGLHRSIPQGAVSPVIWADSQNRCWGSVRLLLTKGRAASSKDETSRDGAGKGKAKTFGAGH